MGYLPEKDLKEEIEKGIKDWRENRDGKKNIASVSLLR